MISRVRFLILGLMVLCLVATAQTMATARGQAMVEGQIVLCTGIGPQAVWVDAEGQPVDVLHLCPDCVLGLFAEHLCPSAPPLLRSVERVGYDLLARAAYAPSPFIVPQARDPPRLV